MGTTTDDYKIAIYNEQGLDLLAGNLLSPKLVGTMKLRQKELGQLVVVNSEGRELLFNDGSCNVSLQALRGEAAVRPYQNRGGHGKPRDPSDLGEVRTPLSHRYQFSMYGGGQYGQAPLLPAVIHGWGTKFDRNKFDMALLLVNSVIPGLDIQAALEHKAGRDRWRSMGFNGVSEAFEISDLFDALTGLPVTVTYRCSQLKRQSEYSGFAAVFAESGVFWVELCPYTEIEIFFYETAGIPWEYFAKCSTVVPEEIPGVASYSFTPNTMKYAQPATDPADIFGKPRTSTGLNFGNVSRGEYFFCQREGNSLPNIQASLDNQNLSSKRRLAKFLEGDEAADLRYEKFSNLGARLKLLSNFGSNKKGVQVDTTSLSSDRRFTVYFVTAGHDYSKVHSPLQYGCFTGHLRDGGLMNALGNANAYSFFEKSISNSPSITRPSGIPDDYNGAPWNPTYTLRKSGLQYLPGLDYYTPVLKQSDQAYRGNPTLMDEINKFIYSKTWKIQRWFNIVFKVDDVVGKVPNVNYSPEAAKERQKLLENYQVQLDTAEAVSELTGEASIAQERRIQRELEERSSYLDLIENVLDDREAVTAVSMPFYGSMAYRHSSTMLEGLKLTVGQGSRSPEFVPENWIMCKAPY